MTKDSFVCRGVKYVSSSIISLTRHSIGLLLVLKHFLEEKCI